MKRRFWCVVNPFEVKETSRRCNRAGSRTFRQKKNSGSECNRNGGAAAIGATVSGSGGVTTNANGVCILPPEAAGTLGSGDLKQAVRLPTGEDLCEWVAVNTVEFFQQINMLYGTLAEFCTDTTCPIMSAGPRYEYYWADGQTVKKPVKCSAPRYINNLMTWTQNQLENEAIFPSKIGVPFPPNFLKVAKAILKRLFRVYAHIYNVHFREVQLLDEATHLNTSFKHFVYFVLEFDLVRSVELEPLQPVIDVLTAPKTDRPTGSNNANSGASHHQSGGKNTNGVVQAEPMPPSPPVLPQPTASSTRM
ncbi:mps one binder kinase activator 1 [Echinococcus multilocularis]|uniref:Mps one binder kinase activator 1 n=1 Tax=Echinococcus multilocularis TaxID=6211 RepID=A0A087W069_ECHMU|nr:mps one binder kinase activator 1 [Echinococcus multilocularis]